MQFDITPLTPSIITVIGVGGGGGNAVNHMYRTGISDVSFMVCNTDKQALAKSPIPLKIQLGRDGLGAGNTPDLGRLAAETSIEEIKATLIDANTHMLFITAGMGGGTGTGAAPVIAKLAKELGILTVAIVTIPFESEGKPRIMQAIEGIDIISKCVDSLIIVNNTNIVDIYGDLPLSKAFGKADDLLATAVKSISDIITQHYLVNVDFADVRKVMLNSGVAVMGSAISSGENRGLNATEEALASPLLHHKNISGARHVLLNITSGVDEVTMNETAKITSYIQEASNTGNTTDLIWGAGFDETLEDNIRITIIATGFDVQSIPAMTEFYQKTLGYKKPKTEQHKTTIYNFDGEIYDPSSEQSGVKSSQRDNDDGEFTIVSSSVDSNKGYDINDSTEQEDITISSLSDTDSSSTTTTLESSVADIKTQNILAAQNKEVYELNEGEIDEIPAWLRRNIKLESSESSSATTKNVNLYGNRTNNKGDNQINILDLFD